MLPCHHPSPHPKKRKKEKKLSRSAPLSYKGTLPAPGISSSQGCHTHPAGQSRSAVPALSHCPGPLRTKVGAGGGDLLLTVFPVSTPLWALPLPPQAEGSPSLRFASVQLRAQARSLLGSPFLALRPSSRTDPGAPAQSETRRWDTSHGHKKNTWKETQSNVRGT